jgi:transposase-like protein
MLCPHCRSAVLVEIGVSMAGSRFTMHSCPSCERRWWDRGGQPVGLDGVLSQVSTA